MILSTDTSDLSPIQKYTIGLEIMTIELISDLQETGHCQLIDDRKYTMESRYLFDQSRRLDFTYQGNTKEVAYAVTPILRKAKSLDAAIRFQSEHKIFWISIYSRFANTESLPDEFKEHLAKLKQDGPPEMGQA